MALDAVRIDQNIMKEGRWSVPLLLINLRHFAPDRIADNLQLIGVKLWDGTIGFKEL